MLIEMRNSMNRHHFIGKNLKSELDSRPGEITKNTIKAEKKKVAEYHVL